MKSYFFVGFSIYKKKMGVNMFFVLNDFYKNQERHLKKSFKKLRKKIGEELKKFLILVNLKFDFLKFGFLGLKEEP